MARIVSLLRLDLSYSGGLVLHTATSGAVPSLREVRLLVEEDGCLVALGASRTNIAYLCGIPAEAIEAAMLGVVTALDWSASWTELRVQLDTRFPDLPAPARMLFEMAAADGAARSAGQPLWRWLEGDGRDPGRVTETNQTLFWQGTADLLARAEGYAARGFRQLKLRVGVGEFREDLERLRLLRERLGPGARLSVDANGQWNEGVASERLAALAALGIEYVEQPLPPSDWDAIGRVAAASPMPVMLDESLSTSEAVTRMANTRAAPLGHLKLAKLGGLDRLLQAARTLGQAGIGVMVGQMNEGVVSTLAAAHAAIALNAPLRELYGADGLMNDPALPAPLYDGGLLHLPRGPGLGVVTHPIPAASTVLWKKAYA